MQKVSSLCIFARKHLVSPSLYLPECLIDSKDMMFDSFALAIGLYAAVISKWEPTRTFSYGFGRVQVLSGFVNAVFLMFIAFFILMESIERFMEPVC